MRERISNTHALSSYLANIRVAKGLTLRQVEEATDKKVSNAYLSQLENGRIGKPSPNILHSLSEVYDVAYEMLMERAGYKVAKGNRDENERHRRIATFVVGDNLTQEEEDELLDYLAYIRSRKYRRGRT